ncbi:hypothetical protein EIN_281770 [Entamoeba invadens IP1]|uniref:Uncharacterized protein n=1 Tax=Entamoeba invadens IP1 TaxID=370355 RepID=A0A0A1U011_ENTIV|nr:hypothetical protein EIN_281770 [Entamoeba invadens IP1]ELP85806.1 hypothetical protein EIN_281770 [Entamoeba invadens IP1]|eukprot:XP_004185152.1 hypothetical protein EIN_281770 [Entamoeba invadens IP1]
MFSFLSRLFGLNALTSDPVRENFVNELNMSKYTLSPTYELPLCVTHKEVENLIKQHKLAPLYETDDVLSESDKTCIVCFGTVRQGMNSLNCCHGKRYICTQCLLLDPTFDVKKLEMYCDLCKEKTHITVAPVNIEAEVNIISHRITNQLEKVNQKIVRRFHSFGIALDPSISPETYNSIDIKDLTDAEMARAILVSLS